MQVIWPGWFVWHAFVGVAIGYGLRLFEHVVWASTQHDGKASIFSFAMMIIAPSIILGGMLGYVSLVLLAPIIKDETAISFAAYSRCAFWAFMSLDIRDFLRRR